MFSASTRHTAKLIFRFFTAAFVVICFSSGFAYSNTHYNKLNYKTSLKELIQQSTTGTTSNTNQLSKFTPLVQCNYDVTLDVPEAELAKAKAFFISRYERNLFYVHITIHAP
jgi:hypothetical protein